jgi:hypothetical protein
LPFVEQLQTLSQEHLCPLVVTPALRDDCKMEKAPGAQFVVPKLLQNRQRLGEI